MSLYAKPAILSTAQRVMQYNARRQTVLTENIANVDTPEFRAQDLTAIRFKDTLTGSVYAKAADLKRSKAGHIPSPQFVGTGRVIRDRDYYEATLSRNSVNLEENLAKFNRSAATYSLSSNVLNKYHRMIAIAAGQSNA